MFYSLFVSDLITRMIFHERKLIICVVIFAFILRFAYAVIYFSSNNTHFWADDWEYLKYGQQIAADNWNPIASDDLPYMQVGPGLPILIALSIIFLDTPIWPIFLYNIIITSLVILVLFYLGKHIFSRKVGWILACWGIFYFDFFKYNHNLLKEPTSFFFFPLTVLLLIIAFKNAINTRFLVFSALSYSWLIHFDERYLIYFPLILTFISCFAKTFSFKRTLSCISLWACIVIVTMVPWTIRNFHVFHQIVLISPRTTAFTSFIWGKNIRDLVFDESASLKSESINFEKAVIEGKKYGLKPRRFGKVEKYRRAFVNFWQPCYFRPVFIQYGFRIQKWSIAHNMLGILFYGIFLPFYVIGIFLLLLKRNLFGLFLASIPVFHSIVHAAMIWPLERYRSPIVFCIVCIGIWTANETVQIFNRHRLQHQLPSQK